MDYDDNDIHGQNLHLAGEGSSKFSPVLHPYALSKFDFDDGLQSQLRFDSLVDNEVFLGIPSQEDNQWIEDFSRGSSGIEFSSSAAESCSISRRNNVWSEATSTESVEMLLKSVGQEEMIPGDTIIEESDACDELGGLTGVMEHQLKQDDEAKDAMDSEPALPSNEFMEHFCRLNDVVCTSQNQEVEISGRGSSHALDPNVSSETCVETCVVNGTGGVSRKCDDANQTEVGILVNEAHDNIMEKDSSGSGMQNDDTHSSSQDIASASIQLLNTREPEHQVSEISFESANGLFFDTGKAAEEQKVPSKDTDADGQVLKGIQVRTDAQNIESLPCPSEAESIEQQAVEACIGNIEEPSSLPVKGEGNLRIGEGCSEDLRSIDSEKASKCEPVDMSNSLEIHGQLRGNMHEDLPIVVEGGCNLEEHAIEVSNLKDGTLASSELKIDQTKLGDNSLVDAKARSRGSDHQLDSEASVNYAEASLMSGVESDNRFSDGQGDGSGSNYLGDLPSLTVACSSTELVGETHTLENLEGVDDASGVHNEDSNAEDHASVPMVAGSLQTSEGNLVSISNEVQSSQDVSFKERGNANLPNESSPVDREIVESPSSARRVEPLSQGEEIKVNIEYVQESEYVTTAPALNVHYEKHSALHDRVDGVPLLSETGAAVDQGSDHPDETTKTEEEGPKDTNVLTLKESSQGASEQGLVLELEKGIYHSSTCKLSHKDVDQSLPTLASNLESGTEQSVESIHKTIDQSLPMVETSSTASGCEQAVKAHEVSQTSCNKLEVYLHLSDSAVKEGSNAEELVPGNHEEAAVQENHEVEPLKVAGGGSSADSVKPNFGTSTVVSQSEKEKEELKESMSGSVSLTEVTVQYTSQNVSGNSAAKDERSFNFEVHPSAGLLERETSKDGESVTTVQTFKTPTIVEGSPSTPSIGQLDHKIVLELSHGSSQASVQEIARGGSKSTPERKTKRPSGRASRKENAKRGDHVMETTPTRQRERGDKSCSVSSGTGQAVQFEGLRPVGNVECSGVRGVASIPTSNLPDLNTSVPPSALFHQPFTDLQQVQLRAQIFVYGSLIQRAAPDEACMVSAFGASEGGRSVWEPVWRAYMERIQGQKSHPSKSETPVQPRSGARPPDQSIIRGAHQGKVALSPLGQASSKGTPSPVTNPMIPLSSPLWNVSTPCDAVQSSGMPRTGGHDYHQTLPPLHPFQTPPPRGFVGHNWLSQTHFPGPWVASPQTSAFDANAHFSLSPVTETVKLTPVKESAGPVTSGTKHASPFTLVHSSGPSVVAETSSLSDMKTMTVFPTPNSTALKGRKRKKVTVSEDLSRISLLAQPQTESVSTPVVPSNLSTSIVVSTPALFASKTDASKVITAVSAPSSTGHAKRVEQNAEQNVISKETLCKVEEAELQAQDAAAHAATAVSHSQSVWSQLDKQKTSGLGPTIEAKLASAAVAVAAAASVAKAAAAAAKIASNAALQAKLMADEALASSGPSNPAQSYPSSLPAAHNLGNATPASILMGGNGSTSSGSIIVAAREAARRRVEAASAASKQAENLDAILKAAELAAEAVSQAGKIVGMGSPLPLIELVEAGPEGYWRVPQVPPEQGVMSKSKHRERSNVDSIKDGPNVPGGHSEDGPSEEAKIVSRGLSPLSGENFRESTKDHLRAADGISSSFTTRETDSRVKRSRRASDFAKTIGVVPESEIESTTASIRTPDEYEKGVGTAGENSIKEGCLVEVQKDGDEFKTAWFSANVLGLKDRKAFVCYTELQSDEGSGQLREWVTLEAEANNAPRIRIAHPMTTMQFEGTRKRRRAARGDYLWSVGDRVDVWMQNCWREGVLTEKNKKDDTIFTVHFPAEGKTLVVKAWHLRPTLIWKDGEWIEQSSSREKDPSTQGDTPQEKRLKLGIPAIEIREKDRMSKTIELVESGKPDESRLLPLSANEKEFNIGDQNKPIAPRTNRTGLQKEGSRVIFGVPKPGKKRKFMEVSKHYVAERSGKTNESNDSVKFAKYLMPQGSGSRGWKNTKIVAKEKQAVESKTKVLKSGKSLSVFGRTLPQKDKVSTSAVSAQNDGPAMDHMIKDSGSIDEIVSQQQSSMEFSKPEGAAEGPVLFSTLALPSGAPSKKKSTSNVRSQRVNVGKLAASSRKLANVEVKEQPSDGNPGNEAAEPRRSNRRIQPTSRLLEGLQSSLVIPKFPAVSHDKSHRSHNSGTSSKGRE